MTDEDALLAAIQADPTDVLARLVYADWLDDRGREDLAEYLRLTAEAERVARRLAELRPDLPADWLVQIGMGVFLRSYPSNQKIGVIKLVREFTGVGLAEAKHLSESLPHLFPCRGDPAASDRFRRQLIAIGAEVG